MYTQCPHCETAFPVTVRDLQKASGQMACPSCGQAFNAIERLMEDASPPATVVAGDDESMLKTLSDLTGPDRIRIEDTGVEWRVIEDADSDHDVERDDRLAAAPEAEATGSVRWYIEDYETGPDEAENDDGSNELRYDDNTPLPDDFTDDEQEPETPRRRAEDQIEPRSAEADEAQADLALGEADDWLDLLDEVGNARLASAGPPQEHAAEGVSPQHSGEPPADAAESSEEDALAATDIRQTDGEQFDSAEDPDYPSDIDTQFDLQALELGIDLALAEDGDDIASPRDEKLDEQLDPRNEDERDDRNGDEERRQEQEFEEQLATAYSAPPGDDAEQPAEQAAATEHVVPPQTDEEMTINMLIDQDLIQFAEQQDVFRSTADSRRARDDSPRAETIVETIVMEGDFVRSALDTELDASPGNAATDATQADAGFLMNKYAAEHQLQGEPGEKERPAYRMIGGVAVLALILVAQVLHAHRDTLATYGAFDNTLGAVYRLLGSPVTPDWNVKGWQFESTSGSTDDADEILTISSRVGNRSSGPLPYPLLQLSLTDRREEVVGSKVLEPGDYLAGSADPRSRVPAGEAFTAVVTLESPSPEATGFKLNVCYRETGDRVRCATEDFRD